MSTTCHFREHVENQFWPVLQYVKKYAEFNGAIRFGWNLLKWWVFDDFHFWCFFIFLHFFIFSMFTTVRVLCWGNCFMFHYVSDLFFTWYCNLLKTQHSFPPREFWLTYPCGGLTLGPKFFFCSKMAVTRRRKHLFQ